MLMVNTCGEHIIQIIQSDGKNDLNIKDKTDKAVGNVKRIMNALTERPYGRHAFQAALLMRQAMLLGGLLTNAESWNHITEANLTKLAMPDTMLHRSLLSTTGNPSKVFMCLELCVIPVKYVIMTKRINFLHYIISENMTSTLRQVYEAMKCESRKGDFHYLVTKDLKDLNIDMSENDIQKHSKKAWKMFITKKVREYVLNHLVEENSKLDNTKEIIFNELKLGNYLKDNRNLSSSKIIFSVRSKTLDIKAWQPWKYFDNLCVLCERKAETMDHFMQCIAYKNIPPIHSWKHAWKQS